MVGGTGTRTLRARFVLANVAPWVLAGLLGEERDPAAKPAGAQLKVNFLLSRLPRLASGADPRIAFAGTLHLGRGLPRPRAGLRARPPPGRSRRACPARSTATR